jgi:hypothetical protein
MGADTPLAVKVTLPGRTIVPGVAERLATTGIDSFTVTVVLTVWLHDPSLSRARAETVCCPTGQFAVFPVQLQPSLLCESLPNNVLPR